MTDENTGLSFTVKKTLVPNIFYVNYNSTSNIKQLTELRRVIHFNLVPGDLEGCDERGELDALAATAGEPRLRVRHLD